MLRVASCSLSLRVSFRLFSVPSRTSLTCDRPCHGADVSRSNEVGRSRDSIARLLLGDLSTSSQMLLGCEEDITLVLEDSWIMDGYCVWLAGASSSTHEPMCAKEDIVLRCLSDMVAELTEDTCRRWKCSIYQYVSLLPVESPVLQASNLYKFILEILVICHTYVELLKSGTSRISVSSVVSNTSSQRPLLHGHGMLCTSYTRLRAFTTDFVIFRLFLIPSFVKVASLFCQTLDIAPLTFLLMGGAITTRTSSRVGEAGTGHGGL